MTCAACSFPAFLVGLWLGVYGSVAVVMIGRRVATRYARKLAAENQVRRERLRRFMADNEGPFPPKGLV